MKVSSVISVIRLHVLLMSITPGISKVKLRLLQYSSIVKENKPFNLTCKATDDNELMETITWRGNDNTVSISNTTNTTITEIKSKDKKSIRSTLSVSKPPALRNFHYYCYYAGRGSPQIFTLLLLEDGSIPTVAIKSNGTHLGKLSFIEAELGEEVTLVCQVSYKYTGISEPSSFKLSVIWKKEGTDMNIMVKPINYSVGNISFDEKLDRLIKSPKTGGRYYCQSLFTFAKESYGRNASVELRIKPKPAADTEKEVKHFAGEDVDLQCDIIGYPIKYEWQFEDGTNITEDVSPRLSVKGNVLSVEDITYSDRKKYICLADYSNGTLVIKQTITLRVKDPKAPLWPFLGIVAEVIFIAAIIGGTEYYKSRRRHQTDGGPKGIDPEPESTTVTQNEQVHSEVPLVSRVKLVD